jgi:outer membrane protein OmpA-like peptidoglycan-associated protein
MRNYLTILVILLLISFFAAKQISAQTNLDENALLSQSIILSLDGGISYGFSDYKNSSLGPSVKGSLEYYPIIIQNSRLGFKVSVSGLKLNFDDPRNSVSSNDGPRNIPNEVTTDIIQLGTGFSLGYAFGDYILPSITIGGSYLLINPTDSDGNSLLFNSEERYSKGIITFALEGELKVKVSERFCINTLISYCPTSTDYLEDISAATNNDTYLTGMIGFSYALSGNFDVDEDGIKDNTDLCPDNKEDFDGFEDEDGCPDLDNDGDGIQDTEDKCPNEVEDIDGFEDLDGCPDLDNDGDGILDVNDKCPDKAEDIDGFEDEDGCPDPDNDGDEILDINDRCPDKAETINNFEDLDGCPDNVTQQETFYQFNLRGEDTFNNSSSNLKDAAKLVLNEIAFYIQNQIGSKWRIEGHMDSQGAVYSIKKLSYDRAKTVFDYLVSQGVSATQLEVYGLGDSFPIGNNNTTEGRNANRRIMIIRED